MALVAILSLLFVYTSVSLNRFYFDFMYFTISLAT